MRSRSRSRYRGAASQGYASTICWAVHTAVGCSMMLKCTTRLRSWARITSTKSTRNATVGTVKKSSATRSGIWFFRKVLHVGTVVSWGVGDTSLMRKKSRRAIASGFREGHVSAGDGRGLQAVSARHRLFALPRSVYPAAHRVVILHQG